MEINTNEALNKYLEGKPMFPLPTLLLHACCAPCSSAVLERLASHFKITVLYFNPCIYPEEEYDLRFSQFEKLGVNDIIKCDYNHEEYLDFIKGLEEEKEGGKRCYSCYMQRMEKTAKLAFDLGYDYFSTTLSISPHKNSLWINEIGLKLEKELGIKYLYSDFKKKNGYLRSIELSKEKSLYRQEYCGCEFSKR